jgi:hypothetical protein
VAWRLEGEYFENCNCEVVCPCFAQRPADNERCLVPFVCHVEEGERDGLRLDDLGFVLVVDSPAVMGDGGWRLATYIDERADGPQREALEAILSGAEGGVPGRLGRLIGERLGVKFVPIRFEVDGRRRRVEVPGIMAFEVEGIVATRNDGPVLEVTNTAHPFGPTLALARSLGGRYDDRDHGWSFDNTDRNGHYSHFVWQS